MLSGPNTLRPHRSEVNLIAFGNGCLLRVMEHALIHTPGEMGVRAGHRLIGYAAGGTVSVTEPVAVKKRPELLAHRVLHVVAVPLLGTGVEEIIAVMGSLVDELVPPIGDHVSTHVSAAILGKDIFSLFAAQQVNAVKLVCLGLRTGIV